VVSPSAGGQVEPAACLACFRDRSDEQVLAEQVLVVDGVGRGIPRVIEEERSHDRQACLVRDARIPVDVGF